MNFEASTQARFWLFQRPTLDRVLYDTNAAARWRHRRKEAASHEPSDAACARADGLSTAKPPELPPPAPAPENDGLPSAEEESKMKMFYLQKIPDIVCEGGGGAGAAEEQRRQWENVHASARAYFQRFYLSNSIIEFDPRVVMLACIFLAGKVEEKRVNVKKLEEDTATPAHAIMDMELLLLKGLRCHLTIWHPYRALRAFLEDLRDRTAERGAKIPSDKLMAIVGGGDKMIDDLLVTALPLLHSPATVGLAALLEATGRFGGDGAASSAARSDWYLEALMEKRPELERVRKEVAALREAIRNPAPMPTRAELKAINKKLKACARYPPIGAAATTARSATNGTKRVASSEGGAPTGSKRVKTEVKIEVKAEMVYP